MLQTHFFSCLIPLLLYLIFECHADCVFCVHRPLLSVVRGPKCLIHIHLNLHSEDNHFSECLAPNLFDLIHELKLREARVFFLRGQARNFENTTLVTRWREHFRDFLTMFFVAELMIAFITRKSNLVHLLEGLCSSNPCRLEWSVF